jgi:hypothetical protein
MKKNNLITTIVIAVVVLVIGFFAGTKYQQSKQSSFGRQFGNGITMQNGGGNRTMGNRGGFRPVSGDIVSTDDKSITVKLQDGSSKIVLFSDKTSVNKESTGSASDLKVGEKISAFGTENSDGSVTAQSIQLNPFLRNNPAKQ